MDKELKIELIGLYLAATFVFLIMMIVVASQPVPHPQREISIHPCLPVTVELKGEGSTTTLKPSIAAPGGVEIGAGMSISTERTPPRTVTVHPNGQYQTSDDEELSQEDIARLSAIIKLCR